MTDQRYAHLIRPDCPLPRGASVVAYCRDSGNDDQERSVSQQADAVREYCAAHGLALEKIYTDAAKTGSSAESRTALNQMLSDLRARFKLIRDSAKRERQAETQPFGVIVWKSNRLSRDTIEASHIKSDLRMRGLTIVSLVNQGETGNAGVDAMIEAFQQWQDQTALKEISENSRRGLAALVSLRDTDPAFRQHNPDWPTRDGRYLGVFPGTVPKGFIGEKVTTGVNRRGELRQAQRLVPDPATWDAVKLAWEMRHAGAGIAEIHRKTRLFKNAAGYASMFRNRIYTGDLWYGGKLYEAFVPAMIPRDWWEKEQAEIERRSNIRAEREAAPGYHPRRGSSAHLLSGLAVCACGEPHHPMHIESVPTKKGRGAWSFYICDVMKNSRGVRCSMPRVSAKALDASVLGWLMDNVLTIDMLRPLATDVAAALSSGNHEAEARLLVAEAELDKVRRAIDSLLNMIEARGASDALEERLRKREADQRELTIEIEELRAVVEASKTVVTPDDATLASWVEAIRTAMHGEDVELARHAVRLLVKRVEVVSKEKAILHYAVPLFSDLSTQSLVWTVRPRRENSHTLGLYRADVAIKPAPRRAAPQKDLSSQKRTAKRLFDLGHDYRDIGRQLGVSRQTAWNWVNDDHP